MRIPIRAKLIIVMTIVVAAATLATSLVTQGYVRNFYEKKFAEDFKSEVRFFSELQLQRQQKLRKTCAELAKDPDVIAALTAKNTKAYKLIRDELRDFFDRESAPNAARGPLDRLFPARPKGPEANPPRPPTPNQPTPNMPAIDIVDVEGNLLEGAEGRGPLARQRFRGKKGEPMTAVLKQMAARVEDEQEIAYWPPGGPDAKAQKDGKGGKSQMWEVIITPVLSPTTKEPLGAIFVGVQVTDLGERSLHAFTTATSDATSLSERQADAASSGFWLGGDDGGQLFTQTIPKECQPAVAQLVAERIAKGYEGSRFVSSHISLPINGQKEPFLVVHRVLNPGSPFQPAAQVCVYSQRPLEEEETQLRNRILQIGLVALACAMLFILFVTRGMVRPLRALVASAEQIRLGNYDVQVPVTSRDEIGQLANSFNEMADGLKLNQKYQRLLSQVADRRVAEELMNNEAALGGELREVSVLFCDIRGFTSLTAPMEPGEIIALLNEHMSVLTAIVHEHGGVVDKFVGDMIMALFGAPSAHGDDAKRSVQCAQRMIQCRDELNAHGQWQVHVGIGIATGTVVAGCMGSEERLDYTVLGERVNLASRLCSAAVEGEVLIDANTADKLPPEVQTTQVTDLSLKGFPDSLVAYRLGPAS